MSSGLFCGSWYIPYAAAIVPFIQLRRVARHRQRSTTSANLWQGFFIALWVTASALIGLEPDEDDEFADVSDVTDRLDGQVGVAVVTMIVALIAAFFAMQAMRTIDDERPAAPR